MPVAATAAHSFDRQEHSVVVVVVVVVMVVMVMSYTSQFHIIQPVVV